MYKSCTCFFCYLESLQTSKNKCQLVQSMSCNICVCELPIREFLQKKIIFNMIFHHISDHTSHHNSHHNSYHHSHHYSYNNCHPRHFFDLWYWIDVSPAMFKMFISKEMVDGLLELHQY